MVRKANNSSPIDDAHACLPDGIGDPLRPRFGIQHGEQCRSVEDHSCHAPRPAKNVSTDVPVLPAMSVRLMAWACATACAAFTETQALAQVGRQAHAAGRRDVDLYGH